MTTPKPPRAVESIGGRSLTFTLTEDQPPTVALVHMLRDGVEVVSEGAGYDRAGLVALRETVSAVIADMDEAPAAAPTPPLFVVFGQPGEAQPVRVLIVRDGEHEAVDLRLNDARDLMGAFQRAVSKVIRAGQVDPDRLKAEVLDGRAAYSPADLRYAAQARCPCGAGYAYPRHVAPWGAWWCSALLTGERKLEDDPIRTHGEPLPFMFWKVKLESPERGTTRPLPHEAEPCPE